MEAVKTFMNEYYPLLMLCFILVLGTTIWVTIIKFCSDVNDWMMRIYENVRAIDNETENIKIFTREIRLDVLHIKTEWDDSAAYLQKINKRLKNVSRNTEVQNGGC